MVEMIGEQRRKNNHKIRIDIDGMVNERQNISIETWLNHLVIEMVVDIPLYAYTHTQINRVKEKYWMESKLLKREWMNKKKAKKKQLTKNPSCLTMCHEQ